MSSFKFVRLTWGGQTRSFFLSETTSNDELRSAICAEFGLPDDVRITFGLSLNALGETNDGLGSAVASPFPATPTAAAVAAAVDDDDVLVLPFNIPSLQHATTYTLRTFGANGLSLLPASFVASPARVPPSLRRLPTPLGATSSPSPAPLPRPNFFPPASEAIGNHSNTSLARNDSTTATTTTTTAAAAAAAAAATTTTTNASQSNAATTTTTTTATSTDPHPSSKDTNASNWKQYSTEDGNVYYYHTVTGHSTWSKPPCLMSDKEKDPAYQSQVWYENEEYDAFEDQQYFASYEDVSLQGEMVGDRARSDAYLNAMLRFGDIDFKDKIVLDVGCGTGLLSYFAVKAGARLVYAVEGSALATSTAAVVEANDAYRGKIEVFSGRLEDVELPSKVDVIVSEWMGSCLVFESMLGSVLFARDKWLRRGGQMYPSSARIFAAPIEAAKFFAKRVDFWRDVYDVDMAPYLALAQQQSCAKPHFDREVEANDVLAPPVLVAEFDLLTMTIHDIEKIEVDFDYVITPNVYGDKTASVAVAAALDGGSNSNDNDSEEEKKAEEAGEEDEGGVEAKEKEEKVDGDDDDDNDDDDDVDGDDNDNDKKKKKNQANSKKKGDRTFHGFAFWFDVTFSSSAHRGVTKDYATAALPSPVVLSTSPACPLTHWKQLSCLTTTGFDVCYGDRVVGSTTIQRNSYWRRHFNFGIRWLLKRNEATICELQAHDWPLWRYATDNKPKQIPNNAI